MPVRYYHLQPGAAIEDLGFENSQVMIVGRINAHGRCLGFKCESEPSICVTCISEI